MPVAVPRFGLLGYAIGIPRPATPIIQRPRRILTVVTGP